MGRFYPSGARCRINPHFQINNKQGHQENTQQARDIDTLLAQYADSHRNHTNELIHFVCVPAIMFTLLGILWCYPSAGRGRL